MSQNLKYAKKIKSEIHCPVSGCLYSLGSERHFTEKKLLNQHIVKVHAEKKYSCAKCNKSFGLDWWRKHHEKTCGMEWICNCGSKYSSRETLLTHARRNQHKLPDYVITSDKMKQNKASKSKDYPVIVLIQPIIQNVTCIQPAQMSSITPRPILPKTTQPVLLTLSLPSNVVASTPVPNVSPVIHEQLNENFVFNSVQPFSPDGSMLSTTNQIFNNNTKDNISVNAQEEYQRCVSTQTTDDIADNSAKLRKSQASQCNRRKPKSLKVGIESTHTQTAESAVVKIKKKRSRRKSIAITTEPSMLNDQIDYSQNSFWPGLKDFVLQHGENLGNRLVRNSTSTQTNVINHNKILCDSETITDQELFKFPWEGTMKRKKSETCNSEFQMLTDICSDDTLSVLPVGIDNNTLTDLNIFSSNSLNDFSEIKTSSKENEPCETNPNESDPSGEKCSVFSVFRDCVKQDINKAPPPTLSDIHTQTMVSEILDYNLLANMETQTTDEYNFSDLEFSDTETQTPWEDFLNIDDSPLQADQLSIEIQTDFSSFQSGLNLDPFELMNSVNVQNMMTGCSSKETLGVNTETQTLDKFYFPQFTNSESQTLDMPDFLLDTLNT